MIERIKRYIEKNHNYLIFSFFVVSTICWCLEMIYGYITMNRLVIPGVMYGPYLPIYGSSFIILLILINKKDKMIVNASKTFVIVSVVEYISSYITDKFFNNIIWDYSDCFMNINGRICLEMSLIFTVLGLFFVYVLDKYIRFLYSKVEKVVVIINKFLIKIFILDILVHFII